MRKDKSSTTLTAYTNTGYNDVTIAYFIRNGNVDQNNIEGHCMTTGRKIRLTSLASCAG